MVARAQFGKRNGVFGAWVSKPGVDVRTASPGQFLVDTSSVVYQSVMSGDLLVFTEGQATVPAGTYSNSVALPSAFAPYSNLAMMATYYSIFLPSGQISPAINMSTTYATWHVTNGVLTCNIVFRFNGGTGSASLSFQHRVAFTIFRGTF